MDQNPTKKVSQEGRVTGQAPSFPKWGARTLLGPALPTERSQVVCDPCQWEEDQSSGSHAWREPELLKQPLPGTFWGEKRWGSGVNEMNSHLQTGSTGGMCAESPSQAPAREMNPRPVQGWCLGAADGPRRSPAVSEPSALILPAPCSPEPA